MGHTCHAIGCTVPVAPRLFMCRRHWYMVPSELRQRLWRVYVSGQEVRKDPTPAYIQVARECQQAVQQKEAEVE